MAVFTAPTNNSIRFLPKRKEKLFKTNRQHCPIRNRMRIWRNRLSGGSLVRCPRSTFHHPFLRCGRKRGPWCDRLWRPLAEEQGRAWTRTSPPPPNSSRTNKITSSTIKTKFFLVKTKFSGSKQSFQVQNQVFRFKTKFSDSKQNFRLETKFFRFKTKFFRFETKFWFMVQNKKKFCVQNQVAVDGKAKSFCNYWTKVPPQEQHERCWSPCEKRQTLDGHHNAKPTWRNQKPCPRLRARSHYRTVWAVQICIYTFLQDTRKSNVNQHIASFAASETRQ